MKIRRQITGVLCGTLDSFSSRYSDHDGWWVFGLLAKEQDSYAIDLLASGIDPGGSEVVKATCQLARTRFKHQIERSVVPVQLIATAKLIIRKVGHTKLGPVNGHLSSGHQVSLVAEAVSDLGKSYRAEKFIFVAPHSLKERRQGAKRDRCEDAGSPFS